MSGNALRAAVLAATLVLVGGCAANGFENEPAGFLDGYDAGCRMGTAMAVAGEELPRRDERRYTADRDYRRGWDFGYDDCRMEIESVVGV